MIAFLNFVSNCNELAIEDFISCQSEKFQRIAGHI